jgi:hypothetical protein
MNENGAAATYSCRLVKSNRRFFMKYRFYTILVTVSIIIGCANQRIMYQEYKPEQKIHYSQMKNIENISNYAIYLDKGDKMPVKMTLDSELFDIADGNFNLILKQKVYFRLKMPADINAKNKSAMSKEEKQIFLKNIMIYLSSDAKRWAPYTDINAVEKALGLKGGSISFGMGITKQDGITIFLDAKTNRM